MMYMGRIVFLIILMYSIGGYSQTLISGKIINNKKQPLAGVSISIKDSYDGSTSDSLGNYKFTTSEKGTAIIVASFIGYKNSEQAINLNNEPLIINITMKEELNELKAVVITAGSFEASDEKKVTVLKPLDIVTTASANGDVSSALRTLPGTQQVGESAELFVRGGAGYETKQFIDGTLVNNPYFSSSPDIASRGRFSPFLFKGTVFSTGGYSALYGQALSSALILESIDLPDRSAASAFLSPLFAGGQYQSLAKNKKSSWGVNYGYTNVGLYFNVVKQKPDYFYVPQFHNGDINFRIKTSKTGMLKFYSSYGWSRFGLRNADIDSTTLKDAFALKNNNIYANLNYKEKIANRWKLNVGMAVSNNEDAINQQLQDQQNKNVSSNGLPLHLSSKSFDLNNKNLFGEIRAVIEHKLRGLSAIRFGGEYWYSKDRSIYNQYNNNLEDHFKAAFAESDVYLTNDIAAKLGVRFEHSSLLDRVNIAPRASIAYKLDRSAQLSFDYGIFYQKPEKLYLFYNNMLPYMKATHYILTYQKVLTNSTLRLSAFYKNYDQLVKTAPDTNLNGNGYAQGIELFWRDKKTFKNFDYWVSYSYLDTKRDYLNYPYSMTPNFASKHTANLVVKRYFEKIKTQLNANYQFATGRPYYDIAYDNTNNKFSIRDQGKTIAYNSLSFSANYLTTIGKAFTVVVFSVTNMLGSHQVFGYNYSYNGLNRAEINPPAPRFYFLGVFLSWGIDRRQDAINNNL